MSSNIRLHSDQTLTNHSSSLKGRVSRRGRTIQLSYECQVLALMEAMEQSDSTIRTLTEQANSKLTRERLSKTDVEHSRH